jgi:hypothetical protein
MPTMRTPSMTFCKNAHVISNIKSLRWRSFASSSRAEEAFLRLGPDFAGPEISQSVLRPPQGGTGELNKGESLAMVSFFLAIASFLEAKMRPKIRTKFGKIAE